MNKKIKYILIAIGMLFAVTFSRIAPAQATSQCPATGGTVTEVGNYCINTFTNNGTFDVPAGISSADVLVVGGGGGGGGATGGGGGAGGYRYITSFPISAQNYSVTVGNGGAGGTWYVTAPTDGGSSVFSMITAAGGGAGGQENYASSGTGHAADVGGSGGGGMFAFLSGGSGNTPAEDPSQGNNGGSGRLGGGVGDGYNSGGGGGAGSSGQDAIASESGNGGNGIDNSISGSDIFYAGGGGGGADTYRGTAAGNGGIGGGGNGGDNTSGSDGTPNTGGGGGGGSNGAQRVGGNGGSGIVIVRYLKVDASAVTSDNSSTVNTNASQPTKAKIASWNAFAYSDQSNCSQKIRLVVHGKHFNKNASVRINGMYSIAVDVKYSGRLSATFCMDDLLNAKIGTERNIYVTNPDTNSARASKQIHLNTISPQLISEYFNTQTTQGITNVQQVLSKLGCLDSQYVTGIYGPITTQAVTKFQADNGISQTGNVGPLTEAAFAGKVK